MALAQQTTGRSSASSFLRCDHRHDAILVREVYDIDAMQDEQDAAIGGDYVQLGSTPFCARWVVFTLPRSVLRFICEDVGSLHHIRTPSDKWFVFIPLRLRSGVRWDGCPISPDCYVVCPPSSESVVWHGGGNEFAIVSAAASDAATLVDAIRDKLPEVSRARVVHPFPTQARAMRSALIEVRSSLRRFPETVRSDWVAETECWLHGVLHRCLREAAIDPRERDSVQLQRSIVGRAEAFIRGQLGESVSISQLSTVVGVSERSLRNAFQQVCAMSPKRYLRLWQLHQVRQTLRAAPKDHAPVTTAATRHGFYELGRFAVHYRTVFGEPPSATLYRARQASRGTSHLERAV